jgi:hypothetical protein
MAEEERDSLRRFYDCDTTDDQIQGVRQGSRCVPDLLMATEVGRGAGDEPVNKRVPGLKQMRERMREPDARTAYQRRKELVELVFGVLKQQRGMRQFRCRGLIGVGVEWALAATAFNLTRLFTLQYFQ